MANGLCPCTWTQAFGEGTCTPQNPGLSVCSIIFCKDELNIVQLPCNDVAGDTQGVITDFVKTGATNGRFFSVLKNNNGEAFLTATGGKSLNENGSVSVTETLTGQGFLSQPNFCFMENMIGKEVIVISVDNDGVIWTWGHLGGLFLTAYNYNFGQNQGDSKNIDFTFTNSTKDLTRSADLTVLGTYADYDALETYLTTT